MSVEGRVDVILLLALRSGRRTCACVGVLWVVAISGVVVSVIVVLVILVVSVGTPATVRAAATSRA